MKEKNPKQIIRLDGKNVFFEVMNTGFGIGKVQINFIEYDANQEKNSRQKKNIPIYIDMDKFLVVAQDVLSGRMAVLAKQERDKKEKEAKERNQQKVYCGSIHTDMGGISANSLQERETRGKADGKPSLFEQYKLTPGQALSRQFKITPGDRMPWILSAEFGPGQESDTGLIVPQYKQPTEIVRVPVSDDDFKRLVLLVKAHIEAYLSQQYVNETLNQQALVTATYKVTKAEFVKTKVSVECARILVNALPYGSDRDELAKRLNKISTAQ